MDNKDYMDFVKEHIELDKTLYKTKPEYRDEVKKLMEEKQKILDENKLFAEKKLKRIDKKIEKYLKK